MKSIRYTILSSLVCMGAIFSSCTEEAIVIGNVDESQYANVSHITGYLRDGSSAKNENTLEIYGDSVETSVVFGINRPAQKAVDIKIELDTAYINARISELGEGYRAFPAELAILDGNGEYTLAPDEKATKRIGLEIRTSEQIADTITYVIAFKATTETPEISISEKEGTCAYFIKSKAAESDCFKGEDAVETVLFFEVNDTNPLNALEFRLKDSGKLMYDYVVLFAANINYNAETGRVYMSCNPNVQFLLDNNEEYLQPLRKHGMKVIMGVLGNHDESGLAQLSEIGAIQFAQELAAYCRAYNLDGVCFDDEYSNYPDLSNPLFASRSQQAAMRLCYETKRAMPEKLVTVYDYGLMYGNISIDGVQPGEFLDFVVPDYGAQPSPADGMTLADCAGMSIELRRYNYANEESVRKIKEEGWGYLMMFALDPSLYASQIPTINTVCKGLYDQELAEVTHYYKKNDTTRYAR